MCYKGKCLMCIPVENGCLVLAIISAIATGVALLASIVLVSLVAAGVIFASSHADQIDFGPYDNGDKGALLVLAGTVTVIPFLILGVASLIAFIFSVLLCNGICQRRPGQVKAYFVYGVTITVVTVVAAIIELSTSRDAGPGIAALIGCVIYSLFLVLVHQTHSKLLQGVVFKDHVRLVEEQPLGGEVYGQLRK